MLYILIYDMNVFYVLLLLIIYG